MSVQLLSQDYISKVSPLQVEQWVSDGKVVKKGNNYYVAGNNVSSFNENCFVKDDNNVAKQYMVTPKGTFVEMTTQKQKGEVKEQYKTFSMPLQSIFERMGLKDEALQSDFVSYLKAQPDLFIDKDGNIKFDAENRTALQTAINQFAEAHKDKFVNTNGEKFVEFTKDSDAEAIQELTTGDNAPIATAPNADGKYKVLNQAGLDAALPERVGEVGYENANSRPAKVAANSVTTTTREEGVVEVKDDLNTNRSSRKELNKNAKDAYAQLVAEADTETRDAIDLYIAKAKYGKQIDKEKAKLLKYTTTMGGTKEKKVTRDAADVIQLYINEYAKDEDKTELNVLVEQIKNSDNPDDQKIMFENLKKANIAGLPSSFSELTPELKKKAALLSLADACGYNSETLLELMATHNVMKTRNSEQVVNDDKWFINQQAKDFVKNKRAEQNIDNTKVYFSKEGRKNAVDNGKTINTDIGKKGQALVKACPEMLCDEIKDPKQYKEGADGYFKSEDGRMFKFSEDKWKTFMGICCDPSTATDETMTVLFGDDKDKKESFLKDLNLTLNEGRSILDMSLPSPYGETGTLKFVEIVGNANGKISNKELNTLRDMVEGAGYSSDKNNTNIKKALHVLKSAGIGTGIGLLTGGLGTLLSGAVSIAGTTASQAITLSGQKTFTGTVELPYSDSVTTTDTITTIVDGEPFVNSTTHNTPVSGTASGSVSLTDNVTLEGEAPGQDYSGRGNNYVKNTVNSGIIGGIGGAVTGLTTMGGVQAKGRSIDDIFSLKREVVDESEPEDVNFSLDIPQYSTVETRKSETVEEIKSLPAVKWQGPSAYSILYRYEDGTPVSPRDFAKAYQAKIGGNMSNYKFFVFTDLVINGKKIVPVENLEEEYKKIPQGSKGTVAGVNVNPQAKRKHIQGTIHNG